MTRNTKRNVFLNRHRPKLTVNPVKVTRVILMLVMCIMQLDIAVALTETESGEVDSVFIDALTEIEGKTPSVF